jgi:DNA-binding protein HU-beta
MNKTELINAIANETHLTKGKAASALEAILKAISETLAREETVSLVGFGSFAVQKRATRKGRHPRTGKEITIPATKVPVFRPGKDLKSATNQPAL